jgi:cystathionine gamma-synthase
VTDSKRPGTASSTDAIHAGERTDRPHHAVGTTIVQTATYRFEDSAELTRYQRGEDADANREEYGRYSNPTVRELEERMAALEGVAGKQADALAFACGMAAVTTTVFALAKTGDHIVLFRDCYRRTRQFVTQTLARFGIEHTLVEPGDLAGLEAAIRPNTKLVLSESPTNPYTHCVDLEELVRVTKAKGRIRVIVDATFATPINCRPLEFGVDLVIHSATKYLGGHNDVLGGLVVGAPHLISLIRDTRGVLGSVMDPHAAFLVGRGIKTLGLRVRQQNATAQAVAEALEGHPKIERVYYAGLPSHPSHAIAKKQMTGYGGVVSFIVKGGREAAARVVDACQIPTIASSLGGVETLVDQPSLMSYFELNDEELAAVGIHPALVRLSVGCEETGDLVADLLAAANAA